MTWAFDTNNSTATNELIRLAEATEYAEDTDRIRDLAKDTSTTYLTKYKDKISTLVAEYAAQYANAQTRDAFLARIKESINISDPFHQEIIGDIISKYPEDDGKLQDVYMTEFSDNIAKKVEDQWTDERGETIDQKKLEDAAAADVSSPIVSEPAPVAKDPEVMSNPMEMAKANIELGIIQDSSKATDWGFFAEVPFTIESASETKLQPYNRFSEEDQAIKIKDSDQIKSIPELSLEDDKITLGDAPVATTTQLDHSMQEIKDQMAKETDPAKKQQLTERYKSLMATRNRN